MILGVGTDIVSVVRVEGLLERHGRRIAERILTPGELDGFDRSARPAAYLAKRFAAKEAAAKAFGTGFRDGLSLRHIEVAHTPAGAPVLRFHGRAQQLERERRLTAGHLSLSDEKEYAIAFVTLECSPPQG